MKTDVLIIGGGPAGIVTALSAENTYRGLKITVVRKEKQVLVPCGIPYIFGTLPSPESDLIPDKVLTSKGIEIVVDEVTEVDTSSKKVTLKGGEYIEYDKLVFATGSLPKIPPFAREDFENLFFIRKNIDYLTRLKNKIEASEEIVIIGGGFIGVEMSDEIAKRGKKVTLIEAMDHLLLQAFDDEFCVMAEDELRKRGVTIRTSTTVKGFVGRDNRIEHVELTSGEKIRADLVIVCVGSYPNVELAKKAGLVIGYSGGIWVDEYLRTSVPDVFAVGDCAEKKDFFTREVTPVMLASIATCEARIAGANLYRLKAVRETKGTLGIFSTAVGDLVLGVAGLTEARARREGFDVVVGESKTVDRHPGAIPDAHEVKVKLIFSKYSGMIMGAQIAGGKSAGEMINIAGVAIQKGMTAVEMDTLQIGTHPLVTPPPTAYPLITAAANAILKIFQEG
ncbi:MAG: FAD-dependent oxidoreductase [Candidatus Hydrothermae bacterium]|nr:FAD-dependent oxidoreductase [Candidatus Hydrothermae bacterium]